MGSHWHCLSWEDSAVLEQMAAWLPTVSACVLPPPLPTHLHLGCSCRPALLWGPCTLAVHGSFPSCPWVFHLTENLIFRLELPPIPSAPETEKQCPLIFLSRLPVRGQWEVPTRPQHTSRLRGLRNYCQSGGKPGCALVPRLPSWFS